MGSDWNNINDWFSGGADGFAVCLGPDGLESAMDGVRHGSAISFSVLLDPVLQSFSTFGAAVEVEAWKRNVNRCRSVSAAEMRWAL
mmetsp:Transcript_29172/g.38361  ORF Transcript_29172/g.38361 Transcript_29172/m.38361 type:complete len:86 (+) Transcript_29172:883-1140(+)